MKTALSYTNFPNLFDTVQDKQAPATLQRTWPVGLPEQLLVLTWASLLQAYTKNPEPIFSFQADAVQVDLAYASWDLVDLDQGSQRHDSSTSLIVHKLSLNNADKQARSLDRPLSPAEPSWALELWYDSASGFVSLSSARCIPPSFLPQIVSQLERMAMDRVRPGEINFPTKSTILPSVSSPPRKLLAGPNLLHHIVGAPSRTTIAVDFLSAEKERVQLSYQTLECMSSRLAIILDSALSQRYEDPAANRVVPLLIEQSPQLYIAQIAVLKCRASFCPLNLDAPPDRLAFIVRDVGAKVAVTTGGLRHRLVVPDLELHVLSSEIDEDDQSQASDLCLPQGAQEVRADSLAYVMYTSGSTGLPKGVAVSHRAASQALLAHDEHVPKFHRFLQFAAPTFDVSVFEIFFTFYRGATLTCCHREDMLGDLSGIMRQLCVDAVELTPTLVGTLLRSWDAVPSLRLLLTIGEMLPSSVIAGFASTSNPDRCLLPVYGPTEAAIHCTIHPKISPDAKAGTIGWPLSTVSAFVLDEDTSSKIRILPLGHVGELALAGQLADGYINRPEQTQAAFADLPNHGRVYRTGDRARMLPSGEFDCIGRIADGQVKLRGQRIELGEVEQAVYRAGCVRLAIASVVDGNIVVFYLSEPGLPVAASQRAVKKMCKAWLPSFMQPADIVLLDQDFPRLPSGKTDKGALAARYLEEREAESNGNEATNEIERLMLKSIYIEFGITMGRDEDPRSRGIDSLRAIHLASKLSPHFVGLSAVAILSADTIAALSQNLRQKGLSEAVTVPLKHGTSDRLRALQDKALSELDASARLQYEKILPCSQLQCAMLSESVLQKHVNFNRISLEVAESVTPVQFVQAFCRLAQSNDILRSGFVQTDDPQLPFLRIIWKYIDASEQLKWDRVSSTAEQFRRDVNELSFLRPLRLRIASSRDCTIVTFHIHHALYDGWSWDLIMAELESLLTSGEVQARPQFHQFVQFETNFLASEEAASAYEYWAKRLNNLSPPSLPALTLKKCKSETLVCRKVIKTDVVALSQQLCISRQSIPSAAFGTLLHYYYGSPDVVFGSVSSGRTLAIPGVERIIGPCISTLPMRINFERLQTVRDLILHTDRLHYDFLRFGQLSLRDLKKAAGVSADQPLFDVLFVWQEGLQSGRKTKSALSVIDETDSLRYSFVLELEPVSHAMNLKCTYDTSVMCPEQVKIFVDQFEAIIEFYSKSPKAVWKEAINRVRPEHLSIANSDFSRLDPLPELSRTVDELAETDPTRIAVDFVNDFDPVQDTMQTTQLSYRELSEKSAAISQFLLSKTLLLDEIVCLFMDKSISLYISILAVLKAGAAYVVIDPQGPAERTRRILDASRYRCCLTTSHFQGHNVLSQVANVVFYEKIETNILPQAIVPRADGSQLAYAVFTSGSTGIPKGVLITRRNILSNINVLSQVYPSVSQGALLQACSPAFDVSVFEVLYTWHMGMRLCAASNDLLFRDLESFIRRLNITHLSLTPTVAAILNPDNVPSVEMLVTAGEAVTAKVFGEWSGRGLHQGYGPSETTNICSVHAGVSVCDHQTNIGQALSNTSMYVFSEDTFRPLPKGALGEIWIGGDQVGRGYLNDAETTAQKFLDHPQYGRLYRSGDLGRMLPNGETLFHGRQDDQVKVRGQRIQLNAIEHALLQMSAVRDSTCLLIETSRPATGRLVAFWCSPRSSQTAAAECVKPMFDSLQSELPSYMVPDYLIHIDSLPSTSQGKTDKKSLRQLFLQAGTATLKKYSREDDDSGTEDFKHPLESEMAHAIAEITGKPISMIGRDTSFYALGIDSMASVSFASRLRSLGFGLVDVSTILRHASITRLLRVLPSVPTGVSSIHRESRRLEHIFADKWLAGVKSKIAQKGFRVQKVLPSTPLQEAMISQAECNGIDSYHNHLTFSVVGDLQRLRAAWKICIAAHEILRTAFTVTDSPDIPYAQIVLAHFDPSWNKKHDALVTGIGEDRFVMPPYSFTVAEHSENRPSELTLKIHHALYDGHAISLLLQDVQQAYKTLTVQSPTSLGPYLHYMLSLEDEDTDKFWQTYLADLVPRLIPHSLNRGPEAEEQHHGIVSNLSLKAAQDGAQLYSVSILSLLQLTWARLLAYYSNGDDICFGNVYNGRNLPVPGVEKIVGPCFNTLPVRIKLRQGDTNGQLATRLHDHNLAVIRFQPCNLRRIQRYHRVRNLFDTLLLLQSEASELDSSIWTLDRDIGEMGLPLVLEIVPRTKQDQLDFLLRSKQDCLSKDELKVIAEDFDRLWQHTVHYLDAEATSFPRFGDKKPLLLMPFKPTQSTEDREDPSQLSRNTDWTAREKQILQVLRDLSRREEYHLTKKTTIFNLGFDSISAAQIAAELRRQGHKLSGGDIMEAATVPSIALLCHGNEERGSQSNGEFDFDSFSKKHRPAICSKLSLDFGAVTDIRPCTSFQSSILADFLRSHGENYLSNIDFELDNDIDLQRLQEKWNATLSRHDMLRTGFTEIDGKPGPFAMILYPPDSCNLPWTEDDATNSAQTITDYGLSILTSLHKPPWRLRIYNKDSRRIMQLTMLHALFDATTLEIILDEVSTAYKGGPLREVVPIQPCLSRIVQSSVPSLPDNTSISSAVAALPPTKFPNLHPNKPESSDFLKTEYVCSRSLRQLQNSCREAGVTLQVAGQSAWARLLSAYTGEPDNTFGVIVTGRSHESSEKFVVFPCVSTFPVSMTVENSNRMLLARSAQCMAQLMKNPFAAFSANTTSYCQEDLFDSIFVLQNPPSSVVTSPWTVLDETTRASYALSMELMTTLDGKLSFRLTIQTHIMPLQQAELLVKQFDGILLDTLDNSDGEASQFTEIDRSLVSNSSPRRLRIETSVETLHHFVQINAQKTPNKVALEFATNIADGKLIKMTWTYAELDAKSNSVAHLLQENGVKVGDLIGICFDKCSEAAFTILGILKAGGAYIALDPNAPEARKKFILEDSGICVLCTLQEKVDSLAFKDDLVVLPVDHILMNRHLSDCPVHLSREIGADDICYCLYTSGTTGTPKGCLITHDNAVQFILAFQRLFAGHWDSESRFLQFASFHFDVSIMEQFWSWSIGICVTSAPRDLLLEDLSAAIRALQITHIDLTPSLARLLTPQECPSLCRGAFITGGEQLRQEIIDEWADEGILYNGYGPSEVTIGCTMYPRIPKSAKPSNIGFAYDNACLHVLDLHTRRPVLKGGIGELCISGPLVGKGYLNRPSLTAEKFEYVEELGTRVYHSGDLVRLLYDASVCFVGRTDDQVKLRGQRIEIGEINHAIRQASSAVKDVATVVVQHHEGSQEQLVSFLAFLESRTGSAEVIMDVAACHLSSVLLARQNCISTLPMYMVPSHIIPINFLPLSANNKIDDKFLRMMFQHLSTSELQDFSASSSLERAIDPAAMRQVAMAVSEVTHIPIDQITASSRLFELGIDSISVISLSRQLNSFGFNAASPSILMKNSMVADLVFALAEAPSILDNVVPATQNARRSIAAFEKKHRPSTRGQLGIDDESIERVVPCTPLQEGMIAGNLNSDGMVYSSSFTFALSIGLDFCRLRKAWEHVANVNSILRTRFVPTSDGFAQVVAKGVATSSITFQQVSVVDEESIKEVSRQNFVRWVGQVQSLEGELWAVVFHHTPKNAWMSLNIFHGLYDGNSLSLLLEEVACTYQGIPVACPKPAYHEVLPLGPLRSCADAQGFWQNNLNRITLLNLPRLHVEKESRVVTSTFDHTGDIKQIKQQLDVTEAAICQACWLSALGRVFGVLPVFGILVSGRALDIDGVENVIGPLFNTVPCQIEMNSSSTMADLVKACHRFNAEVMPYQHSALSKISKWLGRKANEPLFDSLFVFQKASHDFPESRKLWRVVDSTSPPHYPLALEVEQDVNGMLKSTVVAQSEYVSYEQAEALSSNLQDVLRRLAESLHQSVGGFSNNISPRVEEKHATMGSGETGKKKATLNGAMARHQTFRWDATTEHIRAEIAGLAGLDTEDVTALTSIFELGLDSIDAIKLCARLKSANMSITVSQILQAGSIAQMAESVASTRVLKSEKVYPRLEQAREDLKQSLVDRGINLKENERVLPVTSLQEAMLANYEQYYGQDVLEISSGVDIKTLKQAWGRAVSTHDILRTRFLELDDVKLDFTFAQIICPDSHFEHDSSSLNSEDELQDLLIRQREEAVKKGIFQFPLRLTFVGIGHKTFLVLGLPHAVYDGWSINLLHQDVARCYSGLRCERPSYEPILEEALGAVSERSRSFWRNALKGSHPRTFSLRTQKKSLHQITDRHDFISRVALEQAKAFCRYHGVTLQSLGLTCWALTLAHYLKCRDVCFGVVLAGRNTEGADEMMFPSMNTIPFRTQLEGNILGIIKDVHRLSVSISEYQHFPLRQVASLLESRPSTLFDTLFIFQKRPAGGEQTEQLYKSTNSLSVPEYPVNIEMEVLEERLRWRSACDPDVSGEGGSTLLLQRLDDILHFILTNPAESAFASSVDGWRVYGLSSVQDRIEPMRSAEAAGDIRVENDQFMHYEETLAQVLAKTARVDKEQIKGSTSLFHLGLDSISAIKVSSALRKQFINLPVSDMLVALTVEKMAKAARPLIPSLSRAQETEDQPGNDFLNQELIRESLELVGVQKDQVEGILPCTAGQRYFLGVWQASGNELFYPEFHFEAQGPLLSRQMINIAWQRLVQAAPILRTLFLVTELDSDFVVQIVQKTIENPVVWAPDQPASFRPPGRIRPQRPRPAVTLSAAESKQSVLLRLQIHHALYDGVSLPRMMHAFQSLCNGPSSELTGELGFQSYVRSLQISTAKEGQKAFWSRYLRGCCEQQSTNLSSFRAQRAEIFQPKLFRHVDSVQKHLNEAGLSFQALFFTAYALAHANILSIGDPAELIIGVYLANRSHDDHHTSGSMSPTVNVVPLRIPIRSKSFLFQSARKVQRDLSKIGLFQNSTVSLQEVYEWTGVKVNVIVNFLRLPDHEEELESMEDRITVREVEANQQIRNATTTPEIKRPCPFATELPPLNDEVYRPSIDIETAIRDDGLDVGIFGPVDSVDAEQAQRLLDELCALLESCRA